MASSSRVYVLDVQDGKEDQEQIDHQYVVLVLRTRAKLFRAANKTEPLKTMNLLAKFGYRPITSLWSKGNY